MGSEQYRIKKMAGLVAGAERVLDLGCRRTPNLALRNPRVVGLDLDPGEMPDNYTGFEVGDVYRLPDPFGAGSFDAIVAGELIEHLEEPLAFLRACHETLVPGGTLVLSTPNPHSLFETLLTTVLSRRFFYTEEHVFLIPQRWLIRIMERAGFTQVRLLSGGFPLPLLGLVPVPRFFCYQTIAVGVRK